MARASLKSTPYECEFEERRQEQYQLLEVIQRTKQLRHEADTYRQRIEWLAEQRQQDRDYFDMLNRLKDETLQVATHDLKSPLSGIVLMTGMLKRLPMRDQQARYIARIESYSTAIRDLIQNILDLAQIETGRSLNKRIIDLNFLIKSVVEEFEDIAAAQQITIIFDSMLHECPAEIDGKRMRQVIANLLSNVIKYTIK